jgi:two-component system copper resistance phosphate regulon response regulator CusR
MNDLLARAWAAASPVGESNDALFRLAGLVVDRRRGKAFRRGIDLRLSATLFELLNVLMAHRGHVMARTALMQAVWGAREGLPDHLVTVAISRLRRKLDDPFDPKLLHTVHGAGYVLELRDARPQFPGAMKSG